MYDRLLARLTVNYSCTVVSLKAQGHCEGGSLRLGGVVSVEVLHFDLILVLIDILEHQHFHCVLERSWIFEINRKASITDFVLWLFSGFLELLGELGVFSSGWGLGTLLSYLVGSSWSFNFEVNLLILLVLVLLNHDALVSNFIIMFNFFFF